MILILFLICRNMWCLVLSVKLDLLIRLCYKEFKKENDDECFGGIFIIEFLLCYGKFLFYNIVCN